MYINEVQCYGIWSWDGMHVVMLWYINYAIGLLFCYVMVMLRLHRVGSMWVGSSSRTQARKMLNQPTYNTRLTLLRNTLLNPQPRQYFFIIKPISKVQLGRKN